MVVNDQSPLLEVKFTAISYQFQFYWIHLFTWWFSVSSFIWDLLSFVCPAEAAEGDSEDVPAENPAERERSSAADRGCGVS